MISIKKIRISDHSEYEFINDENDFINLISTYLGEDAKIYLEDLIASYQDELNDLKDELEY